MNITAASSPCIWDKALPAGGWRKVWGLQGKLDIGRGRKWGRWFIQQGRIMQKLTAFKSHPLREAGTAGGWVSSSERTGATRHSSG